jgi:ribonuclease HII
LKISVHNLPPLTEGNKPSVRNPFFHETKARKAGFDLIAGVDEAGRGPLAGPVAAAAVILPQGVTLPGVRDSKQLTEKAREEASSVIRQMALAVSIGVVSHHFIDEFNILQASLEAMKRAVLSLDPAADYLLVDGIHAVPIPIPQMSLKKGDQRSLSISAASVMAKVYRDRIMRFYDERFPEYGFRENKGYGTQKHLAALRRHGPCPVHRMTFKRVMGDK